jgi:hypothetical protein
MDEITDGRMEQTTKQTKYTKTEERRKAPPPEETTTPVPRISMRTLKRTEGKYHETCETHENGKTKGVREKTNPRKHTARQMPNAESV